MIDFIRTFIYTSLSRLHSFQDTEGNLEVHNLLHVVSNVAALIKIL
jgi:hypothetical protein